MPIHYVCLGCREEVFLPDGKAGQLCACPRCRLKFLAPAPNCREVPPSHRGSVAPRASLGVAPPPPLYPLEGAASAGPPRSRAPAGPPTDPLPTGSAPPDEDDDSDEEEGLFGVGGSGGKGLFGADDEELEVGELFGGAAPAARPARAGPAGFRLVALEGLPDQTDFPLPGGEVYLMGRDRDAHIKLLSTSVSRRQARIDATSEPPVLIDLGSANGTKVNGLPVDRHPLRQGDLIKVGKVLLRFQSL